MAKIIIYVLCYDDATEALANTQYGAFDWARVHRIKKHTHLFEGIMYQEELLNMYSEWKCADFVGTISYSFTSKVPLNHLIRMIERAIHEKPDVTMFWSRARDDGIGGHNQHLIQLYKSVLDMLISKTHPKVSQLYCFSNYWMATPKHMLLYIDFFNRTLLPLLEESPHVWDNSLYVAGNLTSDQLLKITKRVPYYPFHPFINERLVAPYFQSINANILH